MQAVNLLPADAARAKRRVAAEGDVSHKRVLLTAAAVAGVVVVALGAAFFQAHRSVSDRQSTLNGLEVKVADAEAKAASVQAARSTAQARQVAVTDVTSKRITWEKVLRDLSRALPTNVQLHSLQAQSPTPTVSTSTTAAVSTTPTSGVTPTAFTVTGVTSSQRAVAHVIDRLSALPWLNDVSLQSSTRSATGTGTGGTVQFTIGANLGSIGGK
jgi:Tfp pilus assembly protein PilN